MRTFVLILALATFLLSCQNNNNVNTRVQDLNKAFITAWNNKDTAKIDSFLAADVQFLQADRHYNGKAEVASHWVQPTLPTISNLRTNAVSSAVDDHTAYEGGTFSVDVFTPGAPSAIGEGNYLFLWKKQPDNSWKISYIQLEDLPIQGTAGR
jgi:ketosteroid isomerase-like protein